MYNFKDFTKKIDSIHVIKEGPKNISMHCNIMIFT